MLARGTRNKDLTRLCAIIRRRQNSVAKIRRVDDRVIIQIAADPQSEMPKSLRVFATNKSTLLRDCEAFAERVNGLCGSLVPKSSRSCNFTLTTTTSLQTPLTESNRSVCDA